LLIKRGNQEGVHITPHWLSFTGGPSMNEALISGNLDIASGGVAPMLVITDRTRDNLGVKGLECMNSMPLYLNTTNPAVHSLKDFTEKDRIALPAVKVSIQAIILDMAAAKEFGQSKFNKVDPLTVSMSHPDGLSALLNGTAGITAHFTSAPFMYEELKNPKVHRVLDSYKVLGGPHTFNCLWATKSFVSDNPKVVTAFQLALNDAETFIRQHPAQTAKIYLSTQKKSSLTQAEVEKMIKDPENKWDIEPQKVLVFAKFMKKIGLIKSVPSSISDLFFLQTPPITGN
ncbi:MAG: ABC transporter substrate-binding protein, partial [Acidocella sp.]|nr:ABC transporter substrate-binding protein [Acidocella sp.]